VWSGVKRVNVAPGTQHLERLSIVFKDCACSKRLSYFLNGGQEVSGSPLKDIRIFRFPVNLIASADSATSGDGGARFNCSKVHLLRAT
jgi:hypothetical protein